MVEPSDDANREMSDSPGSPILTRPRKRKRHTYLQVSAVAEIFPDITPTVLCMLCENVLAVPSAVLQVVPNATVNQLSRFFKVPIQRKRGLIEESSREETLLDMVERDQEQRQV